jgi:hypothetical protein
VIISLVPIDRIGDVWGLVEPILSQAIEKSGGRHTNVSVLDQCLNSKISLWVVMDGDKIISAFTVRIVDYPERRSLSVELLAGEKFKEWTEEMFDVMSRWAKHYGCTHLEASGRDGWERLGKTWGFKRAYTVIEREL